MHFILLLINISCVCLLMILFEVQIPADIVVNAMIVAMAAHASENGLFIYHSASSIGNPLPYSVVTDAAYNYFSQHPCVDRDGNIVHAKPPLFLESMRSFRGYMYTRYKAPLQASIYSTLTKIKYLIL
jgi:fatty acyl-CoA reductase